MGDTKFGAYIRARMNKIGMIQKELAAEMGISEFRLSRILSGKRKMTIDEAYMIARVLERGIDEVVWVYGNGSRR